MRHNLRERLYPDAPTRPKHELAPTLEPTSGHLRSVQEEATKRRAAWNRAWRHFLQAIPPADAAAVRNCGLSLVRFHNPKTGMDFLVPKYCHNYYCPTCPKQAHFLRALYHARKLASLDPSEDEPVPRVVNLVFTLPPDLHAWARDDPRVMPAWRKAIMRTIGEAYGYKGRQGCPLERAAFQELGAIFNLHAIGDEATPWPKWAPHYDIIMPAWRKDAEKLVPLRATWPEKFSQTRTRYRDNLRHTLLPLARVPTPRPFLVSFLQSDFDTVWHVSRPPRTPSNPQGRGVIHVESAMHRIRYSCRPLFVLQNANITTSKPPHVLTYRIDQGGKKGPIIHRGPLGPVVSQLESIREWMHGRKARVQVGTLSKRTYDKTARLAGREPVRERVKRGLVHKATYELGPDRQYHKLPGRGATKAVSEDDDD